MSTRTTVGIGAGVVAGISVLCVLYCLGKKVLPKINLKPPSPMVDASFFSTRQKADLLNAFKYHIIEYGGFSKTSYESRTMIVMRLIFGEKKRREYLKNPEIMAYIARVHACAVNVMESI